jgi:hypothetical protein
MDAGAGSDTTGWVSGLGVGAGAGVGVGVDPGLGGDGVGVGCADVAGGVAVEPAGVVEAVGPEGVVEAVGPPARDGPPDAPGRPPPVGRDGAAGLGPPTLGAGPVEASVLAIGAVERGCGTP